MSPHLPSAIRVYPGDVRDPDSWDRFFLCHDAPDVVIHLAAETGTGQSLTEASRHGSTNVVGTTQLTDALLRHECMPAQILVASSRAVYGEGAWRSESGTTFYPPARSAEQLQASVWDPYSPDGEKCVPLPHCAEQTWPRPTNIYAATKLAQEQVLEAWCTAWGVPLSILRLQNVYGPGQAIGNAYTGVLTHFARQITTGEQVEVYEDGQILRDFVFVDDVVDAFRRVLNPDGKTTQRLDIGGGRATSLWDVANMMCELGAAESPIISGRYRPGDVRAASAEIAAARNVGWSPTTTLRQGLTELLSWVSTQP